MRYFRNLCSHNNQLHIFLKALLLASLPAICCILYCNSKGFMLKDVYLPCSNWNDELFYYKQVEGVLHYGYPLGYFGFNESHALKLSFAAWSPVLMLPWIIWGILFGWNIMSPIFCNIVLLSLTCFLFVYLVKPNWVQLTSLALLFCPYIPFIRYMLSGMSEITCFCTLILFYAFVFHYLHTKRSYALVFLFLLSCLMTLMRPYLILFLFLPIYFWLHESHDKSGKYKHWACSFLILAGVSSLYFYINHYLGAAYFGPLFFTDWITAFFEQGLLDGAYYTLKALYSSGRNFFSYIIEAFRSGLSAGTFYAGYSICFLALLIQCSCHLYQRHQRKSCRKKSNLPKSLLRQPPISGDILAVEIHLLLSSMVMLVAVLLMYKLPEGGRHLSIFIAAEIFVFATLVRKKFPLQIVIIATLFTYLYAYKAHYQIPFTQPERHASIEHWQETLSKSLLLDQENPSPNYGNVIIWVLGDMVDGQPATTEWQFLYALPAGFGISCCTYDYVMEHFTSLQSKYIYVVSGGEIERQCIEAGYTCLLENDGMVLYANNHF